MTIAAELDRIISAKNDILSAINDKGVSTAGTTSISQCPALINAIQTGGGGTPSSMHSTAATVYQWKGSAEFYITMTQIPVIAFTNPSITASATSWSTSRSGLALSDSAIGWKVAAFDTGILSYGGVFMSARGISEIIRPFAANYKPSGSSNPSSVGTQFVWLDEEENHGTLESASMFSRTYSLSAANVLSTSEPVYIGWQYKGTRNYLGRASGSMSASGGDISTALPYPGNPEIEYKTSTVSAEYSSVFTSGSTASRPGGEYSYLIQGLCSGYVSSFLGNRRFIYPNNTAATSVSGSASAVSEARPGVGADRLYDCIKNHTGYTASSNLSTTRFYPGDLFSPISTATYPSTAWVSAITGSAWLGQSSTGHLF